MLHDGGELAFAGRTFEVLHRPGHSPSDTVFWDAEAAVLLAGDHLIKHISSNPLIAQPLGGRSGEPGSGRPRALIMYLESLRLTQAMPVETVLPGHGDTFGDHAALIDERFAMHERRAEQVRGADRRAPAHRARHRPRRPGATSRSRRPISRSARCSATSTCCSSAARSSRTSTTASCTSPLRKMGDVEVILVALLISVVALSAAARAMNVPYPIVLVVGGALLGLLPIGIPEVELDPDLVLVIFLPPLLYSGAFFANLRDLRADLRPIALLSIGLVLATMVVVAVGRARADRGPLVAGRVRARSDRGPDRPRRGDRDRAPARRPTPARLDPRGRVAGQRRDRARGLPDRDHGHHRHRGLLSCSTRAGSSSGRRPEGSRSGSRSDG